MSLSVVTPWKSGREALANLKKTLLPIQKSSMHKRTPSKCLL
nr:suface antigen 2 [Eimeria magna]